jgi:hypothetical protein
VTTIDPRAIERTRPVPVAGTPLFDWKGVVHCHSFLSHDCDGSVDEIEAACREANVDFVVMTDHQTDESISRGTRGMVGDTLFLVGAEVRSPQGTILAVPLVTPLRRFQHPALLAKEAAEQGALTFVCHGELWRCGYDVECLTGVEIVNLHAGAMTVNKVGTLLTALFLPASALFHRICLRDPRVFDEWDRVLRTRHPVTPVGGDDAHANVRVFGPLGGTIGTYREVFATLSTHVLAERLDEASVVEGFRLGRSYVSFDVFGEGSGFDFRARDGGASWVAGDTVRASETLRLEVRLPANGRITLLRDGVVAQQLGDTQQNPLALHGDDLQRGEEDLLVAAAPPPGVYRVEVRTESGDPWIFSSSIRVVPAEPTR